VKGVTAIGAAPAAPRFRGAACTIEPAKTATTTTAAASVRSGRTIDEAKARTPSQYRVYPLTDSD
jgi:hypothetical protein